MGYEAIAHVSQWTNWLYVLIPAGAGLRIAYLSFRKTFANNEGTIEDLNSKIKNTIIASVIGISISGIVSLLQFFYGGVS